MTVSRIPLFGIGEASKSPFVTAKELQNIYVEARPQGEKSSMVAYQTPGQVLFNDFGATPPRGALEFESLNTFFEVHRGVLWEVNNAGVATNRGTLLTTSGRVSMSDNGVQIMIVDGAFGYIYNTSTNAFAQITDADFPANPQTVTFLLGYFIVSFLNTSRFYVSDQYNGLSWNALMFANAETSPDPIVSVYESNGQLILLGTKTTEFWGASGDLNFPFSLILGTATKWGLAARWSIAAYDNSFMCLMKGKQSGQVMLAKMNGYLPQKLSTIDWDGIVNGYTNTADATSYSYMLGGHPMFVISFPSAGASWLYDGSTGIFTKLKSYGQSRHNAEFSINYLNNTLVFDNLVGRAYKLMASALDDNGVSIEKQITGETIASQGEEFIQIDCLRVDMEVGDGLTSGQGVNPQISLTLSRDNGKTWGSEMWKSMGKIGEYNKRVEWRQLGTCRYLTPRLRITDPVPVCIVSACINPDT